MAKILLVEDNELNQDVLQRLLKKQGHLVLVASNGRTAVSMASLEKPDIILMDISLPDIDGYEATRLIRNEVGFSQLPIIALTAHAMSSDREKALEAGCTDFDTKPVDFARLMGKIESGLIGKCGQE